MKKTTLLLAFALWTSLAFSQVTKVDYNAQLKIIDYWLNAQRDFDKLPGISVAIVQDQNIIFKKGYGYADVANKIAMKPETIGSICSISKLFTSVGVMQLWEKGKLRLDDSLTALLPEYKINQQFSESVPITVRSMLTHSSGITRDIGEGWNGPDFNFITTGEMKKTLLNLQTLYPSSTYFQYSNLAMSLLGEIVASKSGTPYKNYVEENILKPMNLSNTHPYLPENSWKTGEMAKGYGGLNRQGERKLLSFFNPNALTPAAGFSSNVIDLAKFASWQLRLLSNSKADILRPSTLKEMQRIQWTSLDKKITWGLGFYIQFQASGITTFGHDGSCPGYVSSVMIDPKKKMGVTLLINAAADVYKYSDQIFTILNKEFTEDSTTKQMDFSEYEGRYDVSDWGGEAIIVPVKGKLIIINVPTNEGGIHMREYKYIKKDVFRLIRDDDKSLAEELVFERDEKGIIKNMRSFFFKNDKIN